MPRIPYYSLIKRQYENVFSGHYLYDYVNTSCMYAEATWNGMEIFKRMISYVKTI